MAVKGMKATAMRKGGPGDPPKKKVEAKHGAQHADKIRAAGGTVSSKTKTYAGKQKQGTPLYGAQNPAKAKLDAKNKGR